jgi:hypothetical protein
MKTEAPMKVLVIEWSLSCFVCGTISLIPVLGFPLAIRALHQYWRVKRESGDMWNPAQRYLKWGIICARISLAVCLIIIGSIILLTSYDAIFTSGGQ